MGGARVVAVGRNETVLADLQERFGPRVVTTVLSGDDEVDQHAMRDAAGGPIDVVLDLGQERVTTFGLDEANDAVAHAAEHPGAFDRTVLLPQG